MGTSRLTLRDHLLALFVSIRDITDSVAAQAGGQGWKLKSATIPGGGPATKGDLG